MSLEPAVFADPDTTNTHTATINWGDGSPVEPGIVGEPFGTPVSTAGSIAEISPPTSVALGELESDTEIRLLREQENVTLTSPLLVDITSSGTI